MTVMHAADPLGVLDVHPEIFVDSADAPTCTGR